jgi:proteasome accessory factor BC
VTEVDDGVIFETDYANARQMVSWVLGLGEHARVDGPPELIEEWRSRLELVVERHTNTPELAKEVKPKVEEIEEDDDRETSPIRPERFARLVTLAGILIDTAREGEKLDVGDLCARLQVTETELRQDVDVLNVVNFGGGSYVLYAEVQGDQIEVDPEPYGDNFARPARLLPLEAKALVAAIDLIGEHLPEGSLASARQKIVDALGEDPAQEGLQITTAKGDDSDVARVVSRAIAERRMLEIEHYKEELDEFTKRRIEPYKLMNGREGWYVHSFDPDKDDTRSFRLDRIRSATVLDESFEPRPGIEPDIHGWPRTGEVADSRIARVWMTPERARWAREDKHVVSELADGAVIVALPYAGHEYLAREILKEAGDAVVLEPDDARQAVLEAAEALAGAAKR